ncbi:DEAD/DEAH box helicase family protein [Sphaerospermopsis sp. FACHB-1094]|uniref:DEAD/DEAH box helicase family protein n=1 Tax=Sphaerospermopsis sp. FACHB-1094 TaxID=2692861 RepID=UPI001681EFC4|nr:DEAD/DEAH box helicase family protein [Sphaerospermopsis sp. FACHB-1094]MBD2135450.1 DEAD/DEAH box helicase family protein [Sphaerospermopsis sp. FACHB-1094]
MLDPTPGYIAIRIVRAAFREIQKLSHQYSETVAEILKQMRQGNLGDCKKLKGCTDLWRTKQGDVRVIWQQIKSQEILVIKAGLRKDVYQGVIEDRDRNPTYTLANLMGIEESQVEDIPTFNFNVNKTSSWYQFIYGAYLYSPHLTQEQIKLFDQLLETLQRSYSYSRYLELTNINSVLLQSAPGTGKTVCAAVIASEFYKNHNCNVVLILPEALCSELREYTEIKEILQDQQSSFFVGSFAEWLCQSAPELYQLATSSEELQALQAEAQRVHAISRNELLPYRDLILFRAFVLARDEIYQSRHPNYHENIPRLEFLRRNINLSRWEERLGHKKSWLQGVKEITEFAYPVEDRNTTIFILDEVQDYLRYEITAIIGMLERWQNHYQHNSILWLLGDRNQNIMPTDFDWGQLELTRTNSLRYNYRNTKCIIEFANIFHSFAQAANSGGRHLPQPSNPEDAFEKGELVKILEFSSEEQALQILTKLSKKIINTSSSNQRSLLREISSRVKVICKNIPEKYKNLPGIDYLNVQQAKGREFDGCVAFCVLGGEGKPSFEEATSWYTIFTRPRYRLLVIATTEEINRIGRDKFNKCEPIQISNIDEPLKWITEFANGEQILKNTEGVRNIIYQGLSSKPIKIYWDTYAALRLTKINNTQLAEIENTSIKYLAGVADLGYDLYLLAIAKLLYNQYFRLLDFYFHTLIQQRHLANQQHKNILQELNLLQPEQIRSDSDRIPLRCLLLRALGSYWDAVEEASLLQKIDPQECKRIISEIANELERKQLIYEAARVRMKIGISIPEDYPFRKEIIKQDGSLVSLLCHAAINKIKEYR